MDWSGFFPPFAAFSPVHALIIAIVVGVGSIVGIIAYLKFLRRRKIMTKGDVDVLVIDEGTKTVYTIKADMITPRIYVGYVGDEPLYVLVPNSNYIYKNERGDPTVVCEKVKNVLKPVNAPLESATSWILESDAFKEITKEDMTSLLYSLSAVQGESTRVVVPLGTHVNVGLTFRPKNVSNGIMTYMIEDVMQMFDAVTETVTSVERTAELYKARTKMMRERARLLNFIPMLIMFLAIAAVLIMLFAGR